MNNFSKYQIATAIAILFHIVGLAGIVLFNNDFIIHSTPFNLLLCFILVIWTQKEKNIYFWIFTVLALLIGFLSEVIGVNTGILFGDYTYGTTLGIKFKNVPLIIGINWFIVMYCCGVSVTAFLQKIISSTPAAENVAKPSVTLKAISVITDGATLAVIFDWLIEPVAIKLGYWQWKNNDIPIYNYACWFAISLLLMTLFRFLSFDKNNKFAINLLLIQVMFFLILRTFL